MQAYQKQRTPKQFERLIAAIKSGHISMPLHPLINCYGGMPTKAAFRGMSSIWAGSEAKYSWYGIGDMVLS